LFPLAKSELPFLFLASGIGSLLPDLDHFLFAYFYGRETAYARMFRKYLRKGEIGKWARFCQLNHKKNQALYGHNLLTMGFSFFLGWVFFDGENFAWLVFWLSFGFHFSYDALEDLVFLGRLNDNWWGRFRRKVRGLVEA
jgi:hypothetical protein